MRSSTWVVIAAYNEGQVIRGVVTGLRAEWPNVVVVDDGSADSTALEAEAAGAFVIRHPINLGQGAALATGLQYCIEIGAQYIVNFDADGQHHVEDIQVLVDRASQPDVDIVIGSRFLGETRAMPGRRKLLLKAAVLFTRITTGLKVTDAHNGLRCFTLEAAKKIKINQNRMAHASEILEEVARHKLRVAEVPVTITYTEYSLAKGQRLSNSINILLELFLGRLHK
ncbi:glycosyltransferase family 2 protein [Achromobacter insolitus]|uniref:glycosyltransferase family 2 protein n=1 Tax=Achromobacter insolitus TaxID=217204 RepID=UPI0011EAD9B4|nr:glycosyltransferase family 2 protein [Achromobacter insolitus]QEK95602.1 glycosyltransferase family 2 protein [Achromobacter insolitus]GLK94465.1 glycosyl transferase [Achromobacter xylosoxidans]